MRLLACPECRTQYDATGVADPAIACRCGAAIPNRDLPAADVPVSRCSACGAIAGVDRRDCEYCGAEILWKGPPGDLVCPECYARNPDASRFCLGCGVEFRPQPIGGTPALPVDCIRCSIPMTCKDVATVSIQECAKCSSLWVPGDALDDLVRRVNETAAAPDATRPRVTGGNPVEQGVRYRRCPVCRELMARTNFRRVSGVVIDRCTQHGTWLDADELEEIAGFVTSGGLTRAAEADAQESARTGTKSGRGHADAEFHRVLAEHGHAGPSWARIEKLFGKLMMNAKRIV